jgi:mercuric ion transport protein
MSQGISGFRVELVYDRDCPNIERARAIIRAALGEIGAEPCWTEWDRSDAATPVELRGYGSPTVLVNGRDVGCREYAPAEADAKSCRVYADDCGRLAGTPSSRLILDSIRGVESSSKQLGV